MNATELHRRATVDVTRDMTEQESIVAWRCLELLGVGSDVGTATKLATTTYVDLHGACDLVEKLIAKGHEPKLALEILL